MSHHAIRIPISVIPAQAGTYPSMGLSADVRPGRVPASAGMTAVGVAGRDHLGGLAMMTQNDCLTIVFAGAGPLVRLAAAGLLDTPVRAQASSAEEELTIGRRAGSEYRCHD